MDERELLDLLTGVRTTHVRVCRMDSRVASEIGSHSNVVLLSRQTVAKLEAKHKTRDFLLYRLAETIICDGTLHRDTELTVVAIWYSPPDAIGKIEIYKAVLKATRHGREVFLSTVHRIDETSERAIRRRAEKFGKGAV